MNDIKNAKYIFILLLLLYITTILPGCRKNEAPDLGLVDSWSYINQPITRNEDWRQIVIDSPFQLGEKTSSRTMTSNAGVQTMYTLKYGTYPSIDGSTVAVPMAVEFARQHLGFSDKHANSFTRFVTTHRAYVNLITKSSGFGGRIEDKDSYTTLDNEQPVDIIIVTAASEEELNLAKENGVVLIQKPVCYDAFVFITHINNPVNSLTIEQIRGIYSGKIKNWNEVGGDNAPIIPYQREENSGSQTAMLELVMKGLPMLSPEIVEIKMDMGELMEAVVEYKNNSASIGYTYKYYADNLYKNEKIKFLMIDDIPANEANIKSGLYPLSVCYYGVIRSDDENAIGGMFLDWIISKEGQQCVEQAGYIPYFSR